MMLFLLQKGTKAFHLILGGIFIASMESAATVRDIYKVFVLREYYCLKIITFTIVQHFDYFRII